MTQLIKSVKLLKKIGFAAIIGVALLSSPVMAQKQGLARETLEQLINVPPSDLSDDDLSLRILLNKRLVADNVKQIAGIKLKPLLRADRREKKRRGGKQTVATTKNTVDQTTDIQAPKRNNNPEANRKARDLLRDTRRAKSMPIPELKKRITQSENVLAMGGIRLKRTNQLEVRLAKDRGVLSQKIATRAQRKANDAAQKAQAEQQAKADTKARRQAAKQRAAAEQRAANERAKQQNQLNNQNRQANQIARDLLRDNRPARQLSLAQLNKRIAAVTQALSYPDMRRRLSRQLEARLTEDQNALTSRRVQKPNKPSSNQGANKLARGLLQDQRPAANLGLPELRERVKRTRKVLQNTNLRQRLSNQLLDRLASDRDELRSRVAQREGRRPDLRANAGQRDKIIDDQRPAFRLTDSQLDNRIELTGNFLQSARMRQRIRNRLETRLADDRGEKRRRLLAARAERREKLRNRRARNNGNGFTIELGDTGIQFSFGDNGVQIGPNSNSGFANDFVPTQDIIAAEVDNAAIQRQLLAPPRQRIRRAYTLNEFRARPDLRAIMPGIELDTIRFGTNEAFIRAEEIDNLDAIGEMIEQIVYARPEEVFVIEGHTDAVGSAEHNYGLSVARAEAARNALLDYFNIGPDNLVAIGYGERYLRIPTPRAEQENRRVSVRRITPLLTGQLR